MPGAHVHSGSVLTDRQQYAAGALMALGNFMVVLDMTVANVSIPHIAGSLGISMTEGAWVITSYAVAEAICVPLTGWLSTRFGTVRMFIAAMCGFGLFSLLCGMSPTLGVLVAARIGQGLCGAPIMPLSQTLMMHIFTPERRGKAIAAWAMTTMMAPALGPIVGGYISDNFSWHWIFLINVPIVIACVTAALSLLQPLETKTTKQPIDKVGMLLLVFWIGCLQIMLDVGREHDWFADWRIVALAACSAIGFIVFVVWELTEEHPAVDLKVFRHKGFRYALGAMGLTFGAYMAGVVLIPQWLQSNMGYTAQQAGATVGATAMVAIIVMPFAQRIIPRLDARYSVGFAILWMAGLSVIRSGWTSDAGFWDLVWPQVVQGFAMPFFMVPLTILCVGSVDPEETASAAGLQAFVRTLSVAIATSLVLTSWGNWQRVAQNDMADVLKPDQAMGTLANAGMGLEQSRAYIDAIVEGQAVMISADRVFMAVAVVMAISAVLVMLSPKPRVQQIPQGGGGH